MLYKKRNKIFKKTLIITTIILIGILFLSELGIIKYLQLKQINSQLTTEIKELDNKGALLEIEEEKLKNDMNYIEQIAREEFGMAKKGEKIFLIKEKINKGDN